MIDFTTFYQFVFSNSSKPHKEGAGIITYMARNTRTGAVLEAMVLPALEMGGYSIERQVRLSDRLGGGRHYGDIMAQKDGCRIIISLKWQQSSGTAEQKVPYELMCLADVLSRNEDVHKAYIVFGGDGWTKDSFFLGELNDWVNTTEYVDVVRLDIFVAKANQGLL